MCVPSLGDISVLAVCFQQRQSRLIVQWRWLLLPPRIVQSEQSATDLTAKKWEQTDH